MAPRVERFEHASALLAASQSFLLEREAENTVPLGVLCDLAPREHASTRDAYFALAREQGRVVAVAQRTPPFKLVVTEGPDEALAALAHDHATVDARLRGVLGPGDVAARFARAWCAAVGARSKPGMAQRLYVLTQLAPVPPREGSLRPGTDDDLPLLAAWAEGFYRDAGLDDPLDPEAAARRWVHGARVYLWCEGGVAVSMAGISARTPGGARVSLVYTPRERRGQGRALACVGALSARLLGEGLSFCCLFADQANPTSNGIYRRLGYAVTGEQHEVLFETP